MVIETLEQMKESVAGDADPPGGVTPELRAMWLAKKGRWEEAHDIAQEITTPVGSWIHAHLHVIEGDLWNAGYWYDRAGKAKRGPEDLASEWDELVAELLRG